TVRSYQAIKDKNVPKSKQVLCQNRYFCPTRASYLWAHSEEWPEWIYPYASAIDTELLVPKQMASILLENAAKWADLRNIPGRDAGNEMFDKYPSYLLEQWHKNHPDIEGSGGEESGVEHSDTAIDEREQARPSGEQRRRAGRRQSEDVMRTMRSLDRQHGRRRRLNTDRYLRTESDEALGSTAHTQRSTSGRTTQGSISRTRLPLNLGDTRAQFAPLCLTQTETVMANGHQESPLSAITPETQIPVSALVASQIVPTRLAQQLMVIAGRFAQARASGGADMQGVRPRASMPLINGVHRPPQWTCSHVVRKTRDELSGALTIKSVEIRGGRIVLDDPSSSEDIASDIGS
ncbi:hypothetical protein IW148_006445, partial [Coemansia sp. RSA 1199]